MPIINLTIKGKQAIGDGTEIVSMNSDYVVRIKASGCDEFLNLPIKKLVMKYGKEYKESTIEDVGTDGQTVLQATLPTFEHRQSIELGVYGKETEDGDPKFTSMPATFNCVKSILCGAVVLKSEPKLTKLDVIGNGKYLASEHEVDGFYEVDVNIAAAASEKRTVELAMQYGNQVIDPTVPGRKMEQVTVTKPRSLIPENIKKGVNIGGVVGSYERLLVETEVYMDGEYTPPAGADGFSKVTVNVGSTHYTKALRFGDSFTYDYDTSVNVTIDTPGVVKYENDGNQIIVTAISEGSCSLVIKNLDAHGNVTQIAHYAITVSAQYADILPVEVPSVEIMNAYLTAGIVGSILKYTGPTSVTDALVEGGLYIIESDGGDA